MKPILDKLKSKIISFGERGLDLPLPKSAKGDLKKIRFDGSSLVDIAFLTQIYVTFKNGVFELHARNVEGSQLVNMTYFDKDKLVLDDTGTIRVKTTQEIVDEEVAKKIKQVKSKVKHTMDKQMGNLIEVFLFTHKLLYVITKGFRTQNAQILDFIDSYLAEMDQAFDISDPDFQQGLIDDYKKFRKVVKDYLKELKDVGG